MTPTYIWLIAGVILAVAEVHFAGVGLLFAGLGAIVTGTALYSGMVAEEAQVSQWLVFFVATAVWALLLWKPLQKYRRPSPGYDNIVGETAYVGNQGLLKRSGGEVTWSGTIMKAKLAKDVLAEKLKAGSQVTIVGIKGATLVVKPKE